jgi:Golgi phosphoprotein 3 (GPP34)
MDSLGEDLLLVAIDPRNGVLRCREHLGYGLMGAELIMLAAAGRIAVTDGRVRVVEPVTATTGDRNLDATLSRIAGSRRVLKVQAWVSKPGRKLTNSYLDRLIAAGTIQRQGGLLRPRWPVTDVSKASWARSRLDDIAHGAGPVDEEQAVYAGLADAVGLASLFYRGRENRPVRQRLREITKSHWATEAVRRAVAAAEAAAAAG